MKRLGLCLLTVLFWFTTAHAGVITIDTTQTLDRPWINRSFLTAYNTINGDLDTDNLADGAITSNDIATAVNPLVRDNENIGEYVFTPITTLSADATSSLTSNIVGGTAYIEDDGGAGSGTLHRVVKDDTNYTFTASQTNWLYLDYTGNYSHKTGSTQPTTDPNNMLLQKVVCDGTKVTSVTDLKRLSPANLRVYQDYKNGCVISRDVSDTDVINVFRGDIEFGVNATSGNRRNTSSIDIDFSTNGRNGLDTGSLAADTYYYIWAYPDPEDTTTFEALGSTSASSPTMPSYSGTTIENERLIGWCYAPSTSAISPDSVGAIKTRGGDAPNIVKATYTTDLSIDGNAANMMTRKFYSSGRPVQVSFTAPVQRDDGNSDGVVVTISVDNACLATNTVILGAQNEDVNITINAVETYSAGEHTCDVKWWSHGAAAGAISQLGSTSGARTLVIEEK